METCLHMYVWVVGLPNVCVHGCMSMVVGYAYVCRFWNYIPSTMQHLYSYAQAQLYLQRTVLCCRDPNYPFKKDSNSPTGSKIAKLFLSFYIQYACHHLTQLLQTTHCSCELRDENCFSLFKVYFNHYLAYLETLANL